MRRFGRALETKGLMNCGWFHNRLALKRVAPGFLEQPVHIFLPKIAALCHNSVG